MHAFSLRLHWLRVTTASVARSIFVVGNVRTPRRRSQLRRGAGTRPRVCDDPRSRLWKASARQCGQKQHLGTIAATWL